MSEEHTPPEPPKEPDMTTKILTAKLRHRGITDIRPLRGDTPCTTP